MNVEAATSSSRSQDSTDKPGGVAKTRDNTTILGVGSFDDPDRTSGSSNADTEAEEETTTHHLAFRSIGDGGALDDGTDNDEETANYHADSSTPLIDSGANEGEGTDTPDLVHGGDETSPDPLVLAVEVLKEVLLVGKETTEKHSVEAVHGLAKETDEEDSEEEQGARMGQRDSFLKQSLVESFAALDFLDFDDLVESVLEALLER